MSEYRESLGEGSWHEVPAPLPLTRSSASFLRLEAPAQEGFHLGPSQRRIDLSLESACKVDELRRRLADRDWRDAFSLGPPLRIMRISQDSARKVDEIIRRMQKERKWKR